MLIVALNAAKFRWAMARRGTKGASTITWRGRELIVDF
jgi:hypothetical protein